MGCEPKKSQITIPKIVSVILSISYHTEVCSNVIFLFNEQFIVRQIKNKNMEATK